jgi:predicted transcriptional regulator
MEVVIAMLDRTSRGSATRSHLMYSGSIPQNQINDYLRLLLSQELIVESQSAGGRYTLTEKGLRCLEICRELDEIMGGLELFNGAVTE